MELETRLLKAVLEGDEEGIIFEILWRIADEHDWELTKREGWDEPDYVSIKCRDPDGYIGEAFWEPQQ